MAEITQCVAAILSEESISTGCAPSSAKSDFPYSCCLWLLKIWECQKQELKPGDPRGLFLLPVSKVKEKQTVTWEIRGMRNEMSWKLVRETEMVTESRKGGGDWIEEEWERQSLGWSSQEQIKSLLLFCEVASGVIPILRWRNRGTETGLRLSRSPTNFKYLTQCNSWSDSLGHLAFLD